MGKYFGKNISQLRIEFDLHELDTLNLAQMTNQKNQLFFQIVSQIDMAS